MTTATTDLAPLIAAEHAAIAEIRRDLHRHPELGYQEHRTSKAVQRELAAIGVEHRGGYARGTGVVAHLPATVPGDRPAVALRADMDALPIEERTGKPWASTTSGVMHACGHDGHTAVLLGVARVLARLEHRPNPVTLVFQPAEEGGGGGELMCDDGALAGARGGGLGPPVGRIFGLHNWPGMPLGTIATRPGPLLAATDEFNIRVKGVQGHAAFPHAARDPIAAVCQIVGAVQTIASRNAPPTDPIVVSVTQVHGGNTHNVIPGEASFGGTVRTVTPETRAMARERLCEIARGIAHAMGCECEIDWRHGYPVTRNDAGLAGLVLRTAGELVGPERAVELPAPILGGEDFAYYGAHVPACFFVVGACPEGEDAPALLHTPRFDFNDDAIPVSVEMFCRLAMAEQDA